MRNRVISDDAIAYCYSTSNTITIALALPTMYLPVMERKCSHSACIIYAAIALRPRHVQRARSKHKQFLYRAYTLPFDCIKHVNS